MKEKNNTLMTQKMQSIVISNVKEYEKGLLNKDASKKEVRRKLLFPQPNRIRAFAFSPDNNHIAIAIDEYAYLFNRQINKFVEEIKFEDSLNKILFSQDGKFLLASDYKKNINKWNIEKKQLDHCFTHEDENVSEMAISYDGKYLASTTSRFKGTHIWDLHQNKLLRKIETTSRRVTFSPTAPILGSAGITDFSLWDVETGEKLYRCPEKYHVLHYFLNFSPDGNTVVTCDDLSRKPINFYNLRSGESWTLSEPLPFHVESVDISKDRKTIVFSSKNDGIFLYNILEQMVTLEIKGKFEAVRYSQDGEIFGAFKNETQFLWDAHTGQLKQKVEIEAVNPGKIIIFNGKKNMINVRHRSDVRMWNIDSDADVQDVEISGGFHNAVAASQRSNNMAITNFKSDLNIHTLEIWDISKKKKIKEYEIPDYVDRMAISDDGKRLAYDTNFTKKIVVRDLFEQKVLQEFPFEVFPVKINFFRNDGQVLFVEAYKKHLVKLMDIQSGSQYTLCSLAISENDHFDDLIFDLDKNRFMTIVKKRGCDLWELGRSKRIYSFSETGLNIVDLAMHPDGKTFFAGYSQNHLLKWDLETGRKLNDYQEKLISEGTRQITNLTVSPDGRLLVISTERGEIQFRDYDTMELLGSTYNLGHGWMWITPPDEYAIDGWLYTNRMDILPIVEHDLKDPDKPEFLKDNDERVENYMKRFHDKNMVMNRIFHPDQYHTDLRVRLGAYKRERSLLEDEKRHHQMKLFKRPETENSDE